MKIYLKPLLKNLPIVRNMYNNSGNIISNQFIIRTDKATIFQSYNSLIAVKLIDGRVLLDEKYWDYSVTTGKYRNKFLNETKNETKQKIKDGVYKLVVLNK